MNNTRTKWPKLTKHDSFQMNFINECERSTFSLLHQNTKVLHTSLFSYMWYCLCVFSVSLSSLGGQTFRCCGCILFIFCAEQRIMHFHRVDCTGHNILRLFSLFLIIFKCKWIVSYLQVNLSHFYLHVDLLRWTCLNGLRLYWTL